MLGLRSTKGQGQMCIKSLKLGDGLWTNLSDNIVLTNSFGGTQETTLVNHKATGKNEYKYVSIRQWIDALKCVYIREWIYALNEYQLGNG